MLRFGTITEIDTEKCYARVTFMDDDIVSDWLQICVMGALGNKFFHMFDINEQVACLMDENSDEGVILGALFNDKTNPAGGNKDVVRVQFTDDSFIEYNRATHEYNVNVKGKINITAETEININSDSQVNVSAQVVSVEADMIDVDATNINMTGNVVVTGNVTASGTVAAAAISAPIISGPGVSMTGGNLEADGELKGSTVVAGTIDLGTHVHSGVTTGGGSSGPPTP